MYFGQLEYDRISINAILFVSFKTCHICIGPPSAPTAPLEVTSLGPQTIMVEWGAPESDGGAPLEGYKIAVRDARRQMWMEVGRVTAEVQKLKVQDLSVSGNTMTHKLVVSCKRMFY